MRIVYHVAYYNFVRGSLYALYTDEFENEMIETLQKQGVKYIRCQEAQKVFDKFNTGAELLYVFWADDSAKFLRIFIELISKYHKDLCQEEYYCELGDDLVTIQGNFTPNLST